MRRELDTIPLFNRLQQVLISPEDADYLQQWSWSLNGRYASRGIRRGGKYKKILLHRVVAQRSGWNIADKEIDHINRNSLDNRRDNLRVVSKSINQHNAGARKDSTTGHRGITRRLSRDTFIARIQVNKKREYLGDYLTLEAAITARNDAERRLLDGKA